MFTMVYGLLDFFVQVKGGRSRGQMACAHLCIRGMIFKMHVLFIDRFSPIEHVILLPVEKDRTCS